MCSVRFGGTFGKTGASHQRQHGSGACRFENESVTLLFGSWDVMKKAYPCSIPRVISLAVPKTVYLEESSKWDDNRMKQRRTCPTYAKHPIKAEYNPYSRGTRAICAYANPCGTTVRPSNRTWVEGMLT